MDVEERLRWLETRINSSLRPRNDDMKQLLFADDNKLALHEFLNNEDVRRLFVYVVPPRQLRASLHPPAQLHYKSIFFMKNTPGIKLHKENIDTEVSYVDSSDNAISQLDLVTREVYLPLLTSEQDQSVVSPDRMMDTLHRLMASLATTRGQIQDDVVLALPSVEVLAEAAVNPNRHSSVLHVLETTIISWIKQIKGLLKNDTSSELRRLAGKHPGPLDELNMWQRRVDRLESVNRQLDASIAADIIQNLEQANSAYASSFQTVRKDIDKAIQDTRENLKFLQTMSSWLEQLHDCREPTVMLKLFAPLIHDLLLIWTHSKYYHQKENFQHLLWLVSNDVVSRAHALVGHDVLLHPFKSYSKLKEALRVCAAFRGTYLDIKDQADELNTANVKDHAEILVRYPQERYTLFNTKMYGPNAYQPRYGRDQRALVEDEEARRDEELWQDSPWPPRNAPAFQRLNSFMERCNDVLELVETSRHFRLLADAAEIGGAGTQGLDTLVKEIHASYAEAMNHFFDKVSNVLDIEGTHDFEKAFFKFRSVVKNLEGKLSHVLRQSFQQCPTVGAQLRLLEVFEGISARQLVQAHLKDKELELVKAFMDEIVQVRHMFSAERKRPPLHCNMPHLISKLYWLRALKHRIQGPMDKLRKVIPQSLEGDAGWNLRDIYNSAMKDFSKYEEKVLHDWEKSITGTDLTDRLKAPLLVAEEYDDEQEQRPQAVHVNLDPQLILLLREITYLSQEPFCKELPRAARELLRNTDSNQLRVTATRLETITFKYNTVMRNLTDYELPLFERGLAKIDQLLKLGLEQYTWRTHESVDFIETATVLVCYDLHQNLDIVQTNCNEIADTTLSWSRKPLDVFSLKPADQSYPMCELLEDQRHLNEDFEAVVKPSGLKIHALIKQSFEAVQISEASPAWQDYEDYLDAIVLEGLKQTTVLSLKSMLNRIIKANMQGDDNVPILMIRLELIDNRVSLQPPLDENTSNTSIRETVKDWLDCFIGRGKLVPMLRSNKHSNSSYHDYIRLDEEVLQLLTHINNLVDENLLHCKEIFDLFNGYSFLWLEDVEQSFQRFLHGQMSDNPLRNASRVLQPGPSDVRRVASAKSAASRASSAKSKSSIESAGIVGTGEKVFLKPKSDEVAETSVPTLDEFDTEIDIYRTARDEIQRLQDFEDIGWVRVDLRPLKEILITYASKWLWTFTKYLSNQVTMTLEKLDDFLKRIEPEIEKITGEERDTASFMKMMRIFNEVSAQQQEMDSKFAAMHRTVLLVKKYGQSLPEHTQKLFEAAPSRWSNLKTKVSLAKQRLGPRIQEESRSITKDLEKFRGLVVTLYRELGQSDIYNRECSMAAAWVTISHFRDRLEKLENEAQDLIELQGLLEASVVDFTLLPHCNKELIALNHMWETVRLIEEEQQEWKRHRWQKMDTRLLHDLTSRQLDVVDTLPDEVKSWDVYQGVHDTISDLQNCLPLIDDLSNPAMRTRHWKQLVRVTGGAVTIDNDTLKRMTLGELLSLGLQTHADDVRAIVQRAVKDLSIEKSLKTFEEVWLSKIFQLRTHVRSLLAAGSQVQPVLSQQLTEAQDNQIEHGGTGLQPSQRNRALSRVSNQSSFSKARRAGSITSLPQSLLVIDQDVGHLQLITGTDSIFEELESHQVALQTMQSSGVAGSFSDEIVKWQKRLQNIEAVLTVWLQVQEKWVQLEDIYSNQNIRTALSHDAHQFAIVNKDFCLLMRATEKNPNVLQCCQRKNISGLLEHMQQHLSKCQQSLLNHIERRLQTFPRFYFLSREDVLHIVCNGYDISQVNMYISKVLENVGRFLHEEVDSPDKYLYEVCGVQSILAEKLYFTQNVPCEEAIEIWLPQVMTSIRESLQQQLAVSLGHEKPRRQRDIRSAGARPISVAESSRTSAVNHRPYKSKASSRKQNKIDSAQTVPQEADTDSQADTESPALLDQVSEVVYLATRIQLEEKLSAALTAHDQGKSQALQACLNEVMHRLSDAVRMLRGLEGERDAWMKKERATSQAAKSEGEIGLDPMATDRQFASRQESVKEGQLPSRQESVKEGQLSSRQESAREGQLASRQGSAQDIHQGLESQPIPEEGDVAREPASASGGAVDTMNLGEMPIVLTAEDNLAEEIVNDSADVRLKLLPGQIQKISSLISLLAEQRDLLHRLLSGGQDTNIATSKSFLWLAQLHYSYEKDTKAVSVKCLDNSFPYGWEYQGSCNREMVSLHSERVTVALTQAVTAHHAALCLSPIGSVGLSMVNELSRCLGQPMYKFSMTSCTDTSMLVNIFKGLALTGAWVNLARLDTVSRAVLSVCAQLLTTILDALKAGHSSCYLQSEEVTVAPSAAVFATIDDSNKLSPGQPPSLLMFDTAVSQLPAELASQFRTVNVLPPDTRLYCEVLLISHGFETAADLAHKLAVLLELCSQLTSIKPIVSNKSPAYSNKFGLTLLKHIIEDAASLCDRFAGTSDTQHDGEEEEGDRTLVGDENVALVTAVRNTLVPRLQPSQVTLLNMLLQDLWPDLNVSHIFPAFTPVENGKVASESQQLSKAPSHPKSLLETERSLKDSLVFNATAEGSITNEDNIDNINDAISMAIRNLGLVAGPAYVSRCVQLAHLSNAHRTVIVVGPAGCGKSECIKTYAIAERLRGKKLTVQSVFTKSVESAELLGYQDPHNKTWHQGLIPAILSKFCLPEADGKQASTLKIVQLDGRLDPEQMELMEVLLQGDDSVVLANNERLVLPPALHFIWETESLAHVSPALLASVGMLHMSSEDVDWRMVLDAWLLSRRDTEQELFQTLSDRYLQHIVDFCAEITKPAIAAGKLENKERSERVIWQSDKVIINTFTTLLEAMLAQFNSLTDDDVECYFNLALIWAFGGTLPLSARDAFSSFWHKTFSSYSKIPTEATVFDYQLDPDTHAFVRWSSSIPTYPGKPNQGIPSDAFVHTPSTMQMTYLMGLLSDYGKSVMLVGESGCGKSAIISERVQNVCSGEVAEVLGLTITANRFTDAALLHNRLDEKLEWKQRHTYVPRGNKRLLCVIDDINMAKVDKYGDQTAVELIRQHLDDGGYCTTEEHSWRYVTNVTYLMTVTPHQVAAPLSPRFLRHFAVFHSPYPRFDELETIFNTLLYSHYMTPELATVSHLMPSEDKLKLQREEDSSLRNLLELLVRVTLELQDRLRTMFLPTAQRCHYLFTTRDLAVIFRNLCLSTNAESEREKLLLLWEHECEWVYGHRMVTQVDFQRYRHAFISAVKKLFDDQNQVELMNRKNKAVFSSLVELDSGLVITGSLANTKEGEDSTDRYRPTHDVPQLRVMLKHALDEYNKSFPRIKLALYKIVLEQVCRVTRVIGSPHEVGHMVLVAEGCPARCTIIATLAASLSGFSIHKISPSPTHSSTSSKMNSFKSDLVSAYTKAGAKGEKVLFLLEQDDIMEEDFLVYLEEFVVSGSISHLFSTENVTTIINSIRTEVTQAGLTYTRDVAWQYFCKTVRKNFRMCLIMSGHSVNFQRRCQHYPGLMKNMNFIWFPHWSKTQLVQHAYYHLKKVTWMDKVQHENLAHLLATMHQVMHQQDTETYGAATYGHVNNTSFEKFVERFIYMVECKHSDIHSTHKRIRAMNDNIARENAAALKLHKQLTHEKIVLEERKQGTVRILSQIGQDTAITEQQIRIVKSHMEKITRLKKLLPEYQVSHERAVFKAIAIVADTKKIVEEINAESLAELRTMQKAIIEVEDLMAAIIMILKTPQADLTWQKGAKRQMANLERFIEELLTFDERVLPESTLVLVEPYLKKTSFDPDLLEKKTNISACASLCKWVKGVCRYNRLMISKVKPLHKKVEETTAAIDVAEHKMATLDNKRKALELRLSDLSKGFEDATIDKNNQHETTVRMEKSLQTASQLRRVLRREKLRLQQILDSLPHRESAIAGGAAMAAALCTYLGTYSYNMRRLMLTVFWPNCLRERGIPLVIDSIHALRGRVVDWSIAGLRTASGASGVDMESVFTLDTAEEDNMEEADEEDMEKHDDQPEQSNKDEADGERQYEVADEEHDQDNLAPEDNMRADQVEEKIADEVTETGTNPEGMAAQAPPSETEGSDLPDPETLSSLTSEQYHLYVRSLLKLIVGDDTLSQWLNKDLSPLQLENAAILAASWQRPPLLIDPYGDGARFVRLVSQSVGDKTLVCLDMNTRSDPQIIMSMEKCILQGSPVLLENCEQHLDSMIMPAVNHRNTALPAEQEETRMIRFVGRRINCHRDFRLYMSTTETQPRLSPVLCSVMTIVSYVTSNETLVDDLLMRALARVRPDLYMERRQALKNIHVCNKMLSDVQKLYQKQLESNQSKKTSVPLRLGESDVQAVGTLMQHKMHMAAVVRDMEELLKKINLLKDELFPLARRATMLYAILQSLGSILPEYQFSLTDFLHMFDTAVKGEFPNLYNNINDDTTMTDEEGQTRRGSLQSQAESKDGDKEKKQAFAKSEGIYQKKSHQATTGGEQLMFDVEIPEVPQLPSDNVDYESLPSDKIKDMIDGLTSLVFTQVQRSLYAEHRVLFAMLVCINIQEESENYFTEEEMSLLLQGNPGLGIPLSLADFDNVEGLTPPSWLPAAKWEDVLAISVLPGALDSLCVHLANHSDQWRAWYNSPQPEMEQLPITATAQAVSEEEQGSERRGSPDLGELNDFHQLLLLRILRPDRFPTAMVTYVSKHLTVSSDSQLAPSLLSLVHSGSAGHLGILVMLPIANDNIRIHSSRDIIATFAKKCGMSLVTVLVGENQDSAVLNALKVAETSNTWLLLENVHLASESLLRQLRSHMTKTAKAREKEERAGQKFCLWMTTKPGGNLPRDLIQGLCKLTYDSLEKMTTENTQESQQETTPVRYISGSLDNALSTKIAEVLSTVPAEDWRRIQVSGSQFQPVMYAVCVVQGFLIARQMLGARGSVHRYALSSAQLGQAVDLFTSGSVASLDTTQTAILNHICHLVCTTVYGNVMVNEWDTRYMRDLVYDLLPGMVRCKSSVYSMANGARIPLPSSDTDVASYGAWFREKTEKALNTLLALGLQDTVDKHVNSALGVKCLGLLEKLYMRQTSELATEVAGFAMETVTMDMLKLRAILDQLLDNLPPLLLLGQHTVPQQAYNFPYHRPSVISVATVASGLMPETLGFVLLQECEWMNELLCHIRQNIHDLHQRIVGGPGALPPHLQDMADSLHRELVPSTWLHPNCQPSTHSLASWETELTERHRQLAMWVKQRKVPMYGLDAVPVSLGTLTSVWLGGLFNPQALLAAIKQEKAVLHNSSIDQVRLEGSLILEDESISEQEGGILLCDLYLQGCDVDLESHALTITSSDMSRVSGLYVRPVIQESDKASAYTCPVFMNKARQVCVGRISLPCNTEPSSLVRSGAALILDPGVSDHYVKASYVPAKQVAKVPDRQTAELSPSFQLETPAVLDEEEQVAMETQLHQQTEVEEAGTERSEKSQQSYKPMSPQASPLPPDLQLTRQGAMTSPGDQEPSSRASSHLSEKEKPTETVSGKATPLSGTQVLASPRAAAPASTPRSDRSHQDTPVSQRSAASQMSSKVGQNTSRSQESGQGQVSERSSQGQHDLSRPASHASETSGTSQGSHVSKTTQKSRFSQK